MTEETQKSQNTQEKDEPKEEKKPEATKLAIFLSFMHKNREKTISVKAITDEGKVDASRDDEIELSINPESGLRFTDKSKKLQLKLINGEVDATVKSGPLPEVAILTAKWISGKSPLQKIQVTHLVGSVA
ncbi:MAG: hypothetical protein WBF08_11475 [Candidatus Bathyarchaeia archaeon]